MIILLMQIYVFNDKTNIDQTSYYWFKNGFNENEINMIKNIIKKKEYDTASVFSLILIKV